MNRFLYYNILLFLLILSASYLSAENNSIVKPWKADLQILLGFSDSSVDDTSKSLDAVETLDAALEQLIEHQARIGATIRRFDFTISNLESMVLQTENNKNSLTALDEAREITDMSINQIKQQTALAMMAQAQSLSQTIFQLLQNH